MAETIWSRVIVDLAGRSLLEVNRFQNEMIELHWNLRYWWDSLSPVNLARSRVARYEAPCIDIAPDGYPSRKDLVISLVGVLRDTGRLGEERLEDLSERIDRLRRSLLSQSEQLCERLIEWQRIANVNEKGEFPGGIPEEPLNIDNLIPDILASASELAETIAPLSGRPVDLGISQPPEPDPLDDVDAHCTAELELKLCRMSKERAIGFAKKLWRERRREVEQAAEQSIRYLGDGGLSQRG